MAKLKPIKQKKTNYPFVIFSKVTAYLPTLIFFTPKYYYRNKKVLNRRVKGSAIIMSNHTALIDFVFYLLVFVTRTPRFLMAEVLFQKNNILNWILFGLGGIYVDREITNGTFLTESIETLDKGGIVGVFPEGRLPVEGRKWPYKPGIAMIATHSEAPIVPVVTDGNYGFGKKAHVLFGEPIYVQEQFDCSHPDRALYKSITEYLENYMDDLKADLQKRIEDERKDK